MSESFCPSCDTPLPTTSINIAEGVALCPSCGKLSRLSQVVEYDRPSEEVINNPPRSCKLNSNLNETMIRISLRSFTGALGLLFFCVFWNGILSVFLLIAFAGLYTNLIGPLPDWAPAPTMEGEDGPMGLGMTLFLCIFLTPFVLIGLGVAGGVLMSIFGSIVIRIGPTTASIKTGIGPIGWTQRFDPREVKSIGPGFSKWKSSDEYKELIQIVADRTVRFGTSMDDAQRDWLLAVLRRLLRTTGK